MLECVPMKRIPRLVSLACLAAFAAGCELVSNDDSGAALAAASGAAAAAQPARSGQSAASSSSQSSKSGSIVGTWLLKDKESAAGWYAIFAADGSWVIKDKPSDSRTRVHGTYKVSGNSFSGPMTNPGVGTGEIRGTFSGTSMDFAFIEHWHTPHKTIMFKGTKQ